MPFVFYPAPGLRPLANPPVAGAARCAFRANTGDLYYVVGSNVYYVSPAWAFTLLGTIAAGTTPCSMADNGTTIVLVDSTSAGYQIDLTTRVMSPITALANGPPPAALSVFEFHGGTRADVLDGYIIVNDAGTRNFRSTYLNQIIFDALFFAAKNGFSDNLVVAVVQKREIWMFGEKTTEIWFNAGATAFPFELQPGPFITHGCWAKYSIACQNGGIYWLSQDQNGTNILARGEGYKGTPVSTRALETEWSKYARTDDAIGFCFQQNGHPFYQITFPTADKTWRYDESTGQWHEAIWTDNDGAEHRHRANCAAFAYGVNVAGDWQTGALYAIDPYTYTDAGQPMQWRRGFPHVLNDGNRQIYPGFILDLEAGAAAGTVPASPALALLDSSGDPIVDSNNAPILVGPALAGNEPQVYLRVSFDRGKTFGRPVAQSMGATGEYLTQAAWNRCGAGRDAVFEVFGTVPGAFSLQGAWLDPPPIPLKS